MKSFFALEVYYESLIGSVVLEKNTKLEQSIYPHKKCGMPLNHLRIKGILCKYLAFTVFPAYAETTKRTINIRLSVNTRESANSGTLRDRQ